ncbi:MAG: hypothetical protein V1645_01895 [archaeon]
MVSISDGKIRLEKIVIDLSEFKIRRKTTEEDLERHYDSFIEHLGEIKHHFEDKKIFEKCTKDVASEKKPKLISREVKYPFLWFFRNVDKTHDYLNPEKRRLNDRYFTAPQCTVCMSTGVTKSEKKGVSLDERLKEDIEQKFLQYLGYEGIIEIPNDMNQAETKESTFHESVHYFILRYVKERKTDFVNIFVKKDISELDWYNAHHIIQENITEILSDEMLVHDKDALFEGRWLNYLTQRGRLRQIIMGASAFAMGILTAASITRPYLMPTILLPGRIRDYSLKKYKESKREELIKPVNYPEFKI